MNTQQPAVSEPNSMGGTEETHPAFGVAIVSRRSGTGRALFQSDMLHNETIALTIETASRTRDLNHDWVHSRGELIQVEMSLAQWGALVSSIGIGSGVPVTLRRTENVNQVADLPYQPRIQANLDEVKGSVGKLLARAAETLTVLKAAVEGKKGVKEVREALRNHEATIANAPINAAYAVKSMSTAAEKVTSQARADIESQILSAARMTGLDASVQVPELRMNSDEVFAIDASDDGEASL